MKYLKLLSRSLALRSRARLVLSFQLLPSPSTLSPSTLSPVAIAPRPHKGKKANTKEGGGVLFPSDSSSAILMKTICNLIPGRGGGGEFYVLSLSKFFSNLDDVISKLVHSAGLQSFSGFLRSSSQI